jgi:hypothetical protein
MSVSSTNRKSHPNTRSNWKPLMQAVIGKIRDVQQERNPEFQRARPSRRILEHLIAQAADNMGNDHLNKSSMARHLDSRHQTVRFRADLSKTPKTRR